MDLPVNLFKRAITSGRTPVGTWLVSAAPATAEGPGCIGFDFLVVEPIGFHDWYTQALLPTILGAAAGPKPQWEQRVPHCAHDQERDRALAV